MPLDEEGFLSPEIQNWITKHRVEHARQFELATRMSALLQRLLLDARPADRRDRIVMIMLLARAVATFQSILILTERGLTTDARTLARSLLETTFYFGVTKSDPTFFDALIEQDKDHKRKIAGPIVRLGNNDSGLDPNVIARLQEYMERRQGDPGKSISTAALAQKLGLEPIYDMYYRGLSGDAAHPTVTSLNRHAISDAHGNLAGLKWGPDVGDVGDTLMDTLAISFYLLMWVRESFFADEPGSEFETCWSEYKAMRSEQEAALAGKERRDHEA